MKFISETLWADLYKMKVDVFRTISSSEMKNGGFEELKR